MPLCCMMKYLNRRTFLFKYFITKRLPTIQSIDRHTSVCLIRHTYYAANQIKYKPSSNGKRHLICCTHIPLVARLLAGRVKEDVDTDKIPLCSFPRAKNQWHNCTVDDWSLTYGSGTWPTLEQWWWWWFGDGGNWEDGFMTNFFSTKISFPLKLCTFLYQAINC
jgi:hypothetical protein